MAFTTIQAVYDEARTALETGKDERAIGLSEHLLASFPHYLEAYRILGEAHLNRRELDEAAAAFQRVLRADPDSIPVHVGLGVTYERQGNLEGAIREFEQAFEIEPNMTELRNQLLRLYGEAWGSEHAHVRLKRVGLARMYLRGRNYPKAIQELQDVLGQEPGRRDVKVALAEALWHNQQEDEAAGLAREILAEDPDVLKANLILGYVLLAEGKAEGRQLWRRAQELDPTMGIARTLFDPLPPAEPFDTKIEAFDEAAWRAARDEARRAAEEQERQQRDEQERREREERERLEQEEEERRAQEEAVAALAGNAGSWLDEPARPAARVAAGAGDDDFLKALLLGGDFAASPPATAVAEADEPEFSFDDLDLTPFSLDDLDSQPASPRLSARDFGTRPLADRGTAPLPELPEEPAGDDEPTMEPFSLADLGLSDEEIAAYDAGDASAPAAAQDDEPEVKPFSLEELGLSDDEIAAFNAGDDSAPAAQDNEPEIKPFSLEELGLSDDEIAAFNAGDQAADDPFADPGQTLAAPAQGDDEFGLGDIKPFSFDDWDSSEMGDVPGIGGPEQLPNQLQPLNLDQFDTFQDASESRGAPAEDEPTLPTSVRPFSLDELNLDAIESSDSPAPRGAAAPLSRDLPIYPERDDEPEAGGFSWQERSSRRRTAFGYRPPEPEEEGPSIFDKMVNKKQTQILPPLTEPSTDVELDAESMSFFSNDDVQLRDFEDDQAASAAEPTAAAPQVSPAPAADEPTMEPFSLSDLGLSDEEIAAFDSGQQDSGDEPGLEPFSLSDFGLSPEEMAAFNVENEPAAAVETPAPVQDDEPDMTPFSLADLGLSPEEIAALEGGDSQQAAEPAAEFGDDEPTMEPFSLADLGLSDDEIASLDADAGAPAQGGFDDSFSLDSLGSLEDEIGTIEPEPKRVTSSLPGTASLAGIDPDIMPFSLDDLEGEDFGDFGTPAAPGANLSASDEKTAYDELMRIGRTQGFVDLTDIIQFFPDPEAQADEIDQLALQLHHSGVEIRDGDEIIDMNELMEEEPAEYAGDEPDMTPFSLSDLGLSDDEIAALNDGPGSEAAARVADPDDQPAAPSFGQDDEPAMEPFSLADLGLSDEEIAALTAGDASEPAAPSFGQDDEPDMTPFSLADLGLSEEEIAALNAGDASEPAAPAAQSDEPDMTPFSLADLGLSDDEIAALNNNDDAAESARELEQLVEQVESEPDMTPFSLSDLGLSEEEIAAFNNNDAAEPAAGNLLGGGEPGLEPFSLSEFALSDDELADHANEDASQSAAPGFAGDAPGNDEPDMTPFSLADLGLSDEEIAALNAGPGSEEADQLTTIGDTLEHDEPDMTPFSLSDLGLSDDEIAAFNASDDSEPAAPSFGQDDEPDMTPFSLSDLGLSDDEIAAFNASDASEPVAPAAAQSGEPDMTPFSLADLGLSDEEIAALNASDDSEPAIPAAAGNPQGDDEPDMTPFSLADLGLSDEEIAALDNSDDASEPARELEQLVEQVESEPDMTPFSLADLGLSDDEIATLTEEPGAGQAGGADIEAFSLEALGLADEPSAGGDQGAAEPAEIELEPDMTPFSLADLGLSDDEIASLDFYEGQGERNLKLSDEELAGLDLAIPARGEEPAEQEPVQAAEPAGNPLGDEPDMTPFSFEDLGLTEDEVASLSEQPATAEDEPQITPFSFEDLGLSEEEAAAFAAAETAPVQEPARQPEPPARAAEPVRQPEPPARAEEPARQPAPPARAEEPAPSRPERRIYPVSPRPAPIERRQEPIRRPEPARRPEPSRPARTEPARPPRESSGQPRRSEPARPPRETAAQRPAPRAQQLDPALAGHPAIAEFREQLEANPNNHPQRLALARMLAQLSAIDAAIAEYKQLIKSGELLEPITDDLQELIESQGEPALLQRLHRTLGDAYSKQLRWREAMEEYSWVLAKP